MSNYSFYKRHLIKRKTIDSWNKLLEKRSDQMFTLNKTHYWYLKTSSLKFRSRKNGQRVALYPVSKAVTPSLEKQKRIIDLLDRGLIILVRRKTIKYIDNGFTKTYII